MCPPVGLGSASHGCPLADLETKRLKELRPAHIRIYLHVADVGMESVLAQAAAEADAIGTGLEVAAIRSGERSHVERLVLPLSRSPRWSIRVLVFDQHIAVTPMTLVQDIRNALALVGRQLPVYGGTDGLFADLNAARPTSAGHDGIAYALSPTVHADDDLSLIETIPIYGETVRTARTFLGNTLISVSPITLRERSRDGVRSTERPAPSRSSPVDIRQPTLLGAAWTLGTAASLAANRNLSLTYFETSGECGVMSRNGLEVFPLYHVLADICQLRGGHLIAVSQSNPKSLGALAVRGPLGGTHVLLANLEATRTAISLRGLPPGRTTTRRLSEESFELASTDPALFRALCEAVPDVDRLELEPYELLRVDVNP